MTIRFPTPARAGWVLLWCLGPWMAASASAQSVQKDSPEEYRLKAGDVLEVFVWQQENLSREVTVQADGRVFLPLIGDLKAFGATRAEVEAAMTQKFGLYLKDPKVTVMIKRYGTAKIMVMGVVGRPGAYEYRAGMTLMELITEAGNFTEDSAMGNVRLVRKPANAGERALAMKVNARDILFKGKPDITLEPGDVVYVPRTSLSGFNKFMTTVITPLSLITSLAAVVLAVIAIRKGGGTQ